MQHVTMMTAPTVFGPTSKSTVRQCAHDANVLASYHPGIAIQTAVGFVIIRESAVRPLLTVYSVAAYGKVFGSGSLGLR